MSKSTAEDLPALSNKDVRLLYRIVTTAEESNERPFRALFAAYDQVLAENGISPEHDQVYLRFLLRMGEVKNRSEGLFQRFEELLWKLGIQVDFAEQGLESESDDTLDSHTSGEYKHDRGRRAQIRVPSRRSSFESLYEADKDTRTKPLSPGAILPRSRSYDDFIETPRRPSKRAPAAIKQGVDEENEMQSRAKTLRFHHIAGQAVKLFHKWKDETDMSRIMHHRMEQAANTRYDHTLLRDVLEQFRITLHKKQYLNETEKFFERMEAKAGKARDLFLLTKAFTHWAQCTSEEVLRTSAARRHILRTRYFNAWQDITVVNNLKVRRHVLAKIFSKWTQRSIQLNKLQAEAEKFSDDTLVAKYYREWFWTFCEQRAPAWHETRVQEVMFGKWLRSTRTIMDMKTWAFEFRRLQILRVITSKLISKMQTLQHNNLHAAEFRRRWLLLPTIEALQKEFELEPICARLRQAADARAARGILSVWVTKVRISLEAGKLADRRLLRNAWTSWNDSLRCTVLSHTINDRVIFQALYKWVIAERYTLCLRLSQERLRKRAFAQWRTRTQDLCQSLGHSKHRFEDFASHSWISKTLRQWAEKKRNALSRTEISNEFWKRHVLQLVLRSWSFHFRHVAQFQTWARNAHFYVLTSKTIKTWKEFTETSKRTKRRNAFSHLRRKWKDDRTRINFDKWKESATLISDMNLQANQLYQKRLFRTIHDLLSIWQERSGIMLLAQIEAETFLHRSLKSNCILSLKRKLLQLTDQRYQADTVYENAVANSSASALRKINWQLFQSKRLNDTASSLAERNQRKHYRNMLRYWLSKTSQRSKILEPTNLRDEQHFSSQLEFTKSKINTSPVKARMALGSDMPVRADSEVAVTPGYLRTPSRRAALPRATARFNVGGTPFTPADPPATTQVTPFMKRLRTPFSTNQARSARGDFGRRFLDIRPSAIDDIIENSPATPQ